MPTYQYKCTDCNHEFEEFQRISADPIKTCPECGGFTERVITGGVGFVLKGSGFYTTDYRSDSYKKEMKKDEVTSKPDISKSSSKEAKKESPTKPKKKDD